MQIIEIEKLILKISQYMNKLRIYMTIIFYIQIINCFLEYLKISKKY